MDIRYCVIAVVQVHDPLLLMVYVQNALARISGNGKRS